MKALLFLLLPLTLTAQSKYTLLPDSTVTGIDYQDVRRWATKRLAQNYATRNAVLEITTLSSQNAGLRRIADTERQSKEAMRAAWDGCETERADLLVDKDKWRTKAQRRNRNALLYTLAGVLVGIILTR
jgi:hypothetical protein